MLTWVEPAMWLLCRAVACTLQVAGIAGALAAILRGAWTLAGKIERM